MAVRPERGKYPGSFGWDTQIHFVLSRDYGINRRPSPAELEPYAVAGLSVNEAARRYAAAHGAISKPRPEAKPAEPAAPKQRTMFD